MFSIPQIQFSSFPSSFLFCYIVANRPELVTKEILAKLFMIWHHEKLLPFTATKTSADKEDDDNEISQQSHNNRLRMSNFIFNNVISSRFMVMLVGRDEKSFQVYADFLVELIKENFITIEIVNELSIGLYKHEWNKVRIIVFECVCVHCGLAMLCIMLGQNEKSSCENFVNKSILEF